MYLGRGDSKRWNLSGLYVYTILSSSLHDLDGLIMNIICKRMNLTAVLLDRPINNIHRHSILYYTVEKEE